MKMVGMNIKNKREEKNISLRSLGQKLGLSASFLSQVETGKASPSLATLKSIADTLQTTIGELIGDGAKHEVTPVMKAHERKFLQESGKGVSMYLLTSHDPNKQMEPLLFKLSKKATSGGTTYRHFGQEFVLVLKGMIEITLLDTVYVLRKGDSMYFNSSVPHSFRNSGPDEAEAVWVVTPPSF